VEPLIKNASTFLTTPGASPPEATERRAFVFLMISFTLLFQTLDCHLQPIADRLLNLSLIALTIKGV
jgi:hypothetical protein